MDNIPDDCVKHPSAPWNEELEGSFTCAACQRWCSEDERSIGDAELCNDCVAEDEADEQ